jgi:hypothetical protein
MRTEDQIQQEIVAERLQLAQSVEHLRDSLGEATNIAEKVRAKLPVAVAGAASVGFVLAGGLGATMRYFARRGRDRR